MAVDFIRPTPLQMLTDLQIQAIEDGKSFNENVARAEVNAHFRTNRWEHRDIPLPMVIEPTIFEASEERKAAIKADDAEVLREVADLKARATREQEDRESAEALRNATQKRLESENDELRQRLAQFEALQAGEKPAKTIPAGITPGETQSDGTISSLGRPDANSNMAEIQEWMHENSVPLPAAAGPALNTYGKKRLLDYIDSIMAGREAPAKE